MPDNITVPSLDIDSDCEETGELDYEIKNPEEFINKAQKKFLGTKPDRKPTDRNCLQETIANAFLDDSSAQRFTAFFIITKLLSFSSPNAIYVHVISAAHGAQHSSE